MLKYLIMVMLIITILMIPLYIKYSNGKTFQNDRGYLSLMFTLGNVGQTDSICFTQFIGIDKAYK